MEGIIEISDSMDFNQIGLENPTPMQGGSFFTKLKLGEKELPLYLQLPKATSKHGMIKNNSGTKAYIDLLFDNSNKDFHSWIENLENRCINLINEKKDLWFESDMNLDDIENMFISSIKPYKSGKFLTLRSNIPISKQTKEPYLIVYDESERQLNLENLQDDKIRFLPLVHIDGIKFTSRSFQIEFNLRQVMVLTLENNIQKTCFIKNKNNKEKPNLVENKEIEALESLNLEKKNSDNINLNLHLKDETKDSEIINKVKNENEMKNKDLDNKINDSLDELISINPDDLRDNTISEIKLDVSENDNDLIDIKKPQEVYMEIYRQALSKAKELRQAALDSYLEVKNIKNKYNLHKYLESEDELSDYAEFD